MIPQMTDIFGIVGTSEDNLSTFRGRQNLVQLQQIRLSCQIPVISCRFLKLSSLADLHMAWASPKLPYSCSPKHFSWKQVPLSNTVPVLITLSFIETCLGLLPLPSCSFSKRSESGLSEGGVEEQNSGGSSNPWNLYFFVCLMLGLNLHIGWGVGESLSVGSLLVSATLSQIHGYFKILAYDYVGTHQKSELFLYYIQLTFLGHGQLLDYI